MSSQIEVCNVSSYLSVDKIKFHPSNPRRIRPDRLELLKDSIVEKGFYEPILVWKKGNIVLSGNHRLLAAQELIRDGYEFHTHDGKKKNHLPVVIEDVSEEAAQAILFETNNSYAEWIEDKLRDAIISLEESGMSPLKYGFEQGEIDKMLASAMKDADKVIDDMDDLTDDDIAEPNITKKQNTKSNDDDVFDVDPNSGSIEYCTLTIPKSVFPRFMKILDTAAKCEDEDWQPGDTYEHAFIQLMDAIEEKQCLDWIAGRV